MIFILQKKENLLDRTRPIIKERIKIEEFLTDLDDINEDNNNFEKMIYFKESL